MSEAAVKYCVIDSENTGLFDYKKPADAEGQPRMASLAMIFADENFNIEKEEGWFVRPDGWTMPKEATKIHGLTQDFLMEKGSPIVEVLTAYQNAVLNGYIIVAHNAQHDLKQLRAEFRRAGMDDLFEQTPNVCTMRSAVDVCKIPPNGGRGGYKWPKLSEAVEFFHLQHNSDHSALNDARDALAVARELHKLGALKPPKVHFAADSNPAKPKTERRPPMDGRSQLERELDGEKGDFLGFSQEIHGDKEL